MTVATTAPRKEYVEDGITAVHDIPFQFLDKSEIRVYRIVGGVTTELSSPAHFAVTGGNGGTGTLTKPNGGTNGATLRIDRATRAIQPEDYTATDEFPAETHERALDRLTMIVQEMQRDAVTPTVVRTVIVQTLKGGAGIVLTPSEDGTEIEVAATASASFIRSTIAAALLEGAGIEITFNEGVGTITFTNTIAGGVDLPDSVLLSGDQQGGIGDGGGSTAAEDVRDIVAAALIGAGIDIVHDDVANTITFTNTVNAEFIRDTIGAALVQGSGVSIAVNDAGDQITISGDPEYIRDTIAGALVEGRLIDITINDAGNTITIATSALDPKYRGLPVTAKDAAFNFDDDHGGGTILITATCTGTLKLDAVEALSDGWGVLIIVESGTLTIALDGAITLRKNGATASAAATVTAGGVVSLHRYGVDKFAVVGTNLA